MESSEAATAFAALSVETRLNLLRLLMAAGPTGLPAGDIAVRLALPPPPPPSTSPPSNAPA